MTKAYRQAARLNDKSGLKAASTDFQSILTGNGPHAEEARQYLTRGKRPAFSVAQPGLRRRLCRYRSPSRRKDPIKGVIRQFAHAFEQRDADALVRIWPTIGAEYEGYARLGLRR